MLIFMPEQFRICSWLLKLGRSLLDWITPKLCNVCCQMAFLQSCTWNKTYTSNPSKPKSQFGNLKNFECLQMQTKQLRLLLHRWFLNNNITWMLECQHCDANLPYTWCASMMKAIQADVIKTEDGISIQQLLQCSKFKRFNPVNTHIKDNVHNTCVYTKKVSYEGVSGTFCVDNWRHTGKLVGMKLIFI